ncbi:hypothetical protein HPB52_022991 [Rhipicephalus sanguineus]|uniref:Uncharacterized protein n=1 Tax=Rhipicephalus sanguineus TaxID=34632 RepID=A0A9D4STJ8_RHISA|nr:hypothetical protein HPB52_022991 [Rhipicephalus sanguineus]
MSDGALEPLLGLSELLVHCRIVGIVGHVSWPLVNTVSNPFMFFVQIFLLGLTARASVDQGTTCFTIDASTFQAHHAHAEIYAEEIWAATRGTSSTSPARSLNSLPPPRYFSGHVSWPLVNTVSNPFMFFVQLTCPECTRILCTVVCSLVPSLLMLCGDVELNPGPSSEQILSELLKGQKEIKTRLDEIESRFKKFEDSASAIADV